MWERDVRCGGALYRADHIAGRCARGTSGADTSTSVVWVGAVVYGKVEMIRMGGRQ